MAHKAIELSDSGVDIWHSVNPVNIEPTNSKHGDEKSISYQTAVVADIDIQSAAHKGDPSQLATDFDETKSFLPFTPSIIINSGYGLHAYYIFDTPIRISDDNREEIKRRNNLLLDIIRQRANGKKIDGVGDLPRIFRTLGTFNYKLGKDNAPLCHIIENSGLRFSLAELDEKLNALIIATPLPAIRSNPARKTGIDYFDDNPDLKEFRIRRMLDYINVVDGKYEKWLGVVTTPPMAFLSSRFINAEGGYDETAIRREYYQFNPSGQKTRRHEKFENTYNLTRGRPLTRKRDE